MSLFIEAPVTLILLLNLNNKFKLMKTHKTSIVLSIVTIFICCLFVSMQETEAQANDCKGNKIICTKIGDLIFYKNCDIPIVFM